MEPVGEVVTAPMDEIVAPTAEDVVQEPDPLPAYNEPTPFTYSLAWSVIDEGYG
jgi:hypothetical protein